MKIRALTESKLDATTISDLESDPLYRSELDAAVRRLSYGVRVIGPSTYIFGGKAHPAILLEDGNKLVLDAWQHDCGCGAVHLNRMENRQGAYETTREYRIMQTCCQLHSEDLPL